MSPSDLDCFSTPPEPGEPRPGGKLNALIRAARDARTRARRERARIDALPPELRAIEMRRVRAEWEECKRRQRAEAKRRREVMEDLRELNGKPRKLPKPYL